MRIYTFPTRAGGANIYASHINDIQNAISEISSELSNGFGSVNTTYRTFKLAASTTAAASLNIPSGTAPTSPANGDIWFSGDALTIKTSLGNFNLVYNNHAHQATDIASGNVDNTEFGYLNGVTAPIQTQLDSKAGLASPSFTGTTTVDNLTVTGNTQIGNAATDTLTVYSGSFTVDPNLSGATTTAATVALKGGSAISGGLTSGVQLYKGSTLMSSWKLDASGSVQFAVESGAGGSGNMDFNTQFGNNTIRFWPQQQLALELGYSGATGAYSNPNYVLIHSTPTGVPVKIIGMGEANTGLALDASGTGVTAINANSGGNVGIGTTTTTEKLTVEGGIGASGHLTIRSGKPVGSFVNSTASASTAIANTATETTFSNGSYTVPANTLSGGDIIQIWAWGTYGLTGTPNLTVRLKFGTSTVFTSGAINLSVAGSWSLNFFARTHSNTSFAGFGQFTVGANTTTPNIRVIPTSTALASDWTTDKAITITAQWGTAATANTITMDRWVIQHT